MPFNLIAASAAALLLSLVIGPALIRWLKRLKVGATIQEELDAQQQAKAGTPLMGGLIFILPTALLTAGCAAAGFLQWRTAAGFLIFFLGYGLIGFIDDYQKVVKKHSDGLSIRGKLLGQALIFVLFVALFGWNSLDSGLLIPFTQFVLPSGLLYLPFLFVLALGTTNAVNFTDGMDGLLAGCMLASSGAYLIIGLITGHSGMMLITAVLMGGLLGYLRFNYHPAKVFMGDTGSLALGGALVAMAVFTKTELFLALIGGVYVVEAVTVIIQIIYFRRTGGGRFFLMAPIHHHYQKKNIPELRIVWSFWAASAFCGLAGVAALLINIGGM